ncbi:MAG: diguanylate cyclase [Anaerolineaceae bacterium]
MSSPKILMMDDNQSSSRHLFQLLVKMGYDVTGEVFSMEQALLTTKSAKPDLVLLDISLNRIENQGCPTSRFWEEMDIPVIYLVNDEKEALEISQSGECHYGALIKPAKSQNIRTTIEVALQKHAMEKQLHATVNKSRQIYDFAPIIMFSFTIDGQILDVNRQWTSSLGYTAENSLTKNINFNLTPESIRTFTKTIIPELIKHKRVSEIRIDYLKKDGSILNGVLDASFDIEWEGDRVGLAVVRDVTESIRLQEEERGQRALAEALRETAGLLTSTLNFDEVLDRILETVGSVVPHDAANIMMVWAGMAYVVRFHGYTEIGLDEFMLSLQLSVPETSNLHQMFLSGRPVAIENLDLHPEWNFQPEMKWRKSLASAPLRSRGIVFGFLNMESAEAGFFNQAHAERLQAFADQAAIAIENARLYAEVQQSAITDELTGVYNRRGLLELGRREIERARRYMRDLSILMIDIDHFKEINDNYSHAAGDQVLVELAKRWRISLREVDLMGRIGGDEFTILLPETDLESASQVAGRLLEEISSQPFITENGPVQVSVSIGVAGVGKDVVDLQELLSRADNAMYSAKKTGRNKVVLAGKIGE